jgi:hypothetical protein
MVEPSAFCRRFFYFLVYILPPCRPGCSHTSIGTTIKLSKEEKVMAKRCPECGEMKLYLDCMECDDRYCCGDVAKRIKQEEDDDRRKENNVRHEAQTADH